MEELRMRVERVNNDWTLDYVGTQVGISNQAVSKLETGQSKPSYDVLCKLEKLFNLTHHQLFEVADDNNLNTK